MTHPATSLLICLSVSALVSVAVGQLGEPCSLEPPVPCEDPNTTCVDDVCQCAQGRVNVSNVCTDVSCGAVPRPQDGDVAVTLNETTSQYEAVYTCRRGFNLEGEELRVCEADQWTGSPPVCNIIECPSLAQPNNGAHVISGGLGTEGQRAVDSVATYSCSNGYLLEGAQTRTCQESGQWSGDPPTCKPRPCPVISLTQDSNIANVEYNPDPPVYGSIVMFTCLEGYQLTGSTSLECTAEGSWNGDIPTCDLIDSASTTTTTEAVTTTTLTPCSLDCQNGGTCFINASSQSECACPNGFSGNVCELEDYCVTQPCPVDAVCQLIVDGRQCICPVGFKGDNCAEADPVVACTNFEQTLYLDNSPSDADRSVCLPQNGTVAGDICHNPGEGVLYQTEDAPYITTSIDDQNRFCVTYTGNSPTQPRTCVTVMAFETDDRDLRPWVNDTTDICFLFNNPPILNQASPVTLGFSPSVDTRVHPLAVSDPDSHQSLVVSILGVSPVNLTNNFAIDSFDLRVTKPVPLDTSQSVQLDLTVTDSGIPPLSYISQVTVELLPVSDLDCQVSPLPPLLLHVPTGLPATSTDLGQVSCPNVALDAGLTFELTSSLGPVSVNDQDGTIFYNPDLPDTSVGDGNFSLTVTASVQQPVALSQVIVVPIIANDFRPDCSLPQVITFTERADIPDCSDFFVCSERANVTETCEDDSTLFDVSCELDTGTWQTNVKLCVTGSLINQFGDYQVPIRVINTYGTTSLSIPVTVQNVNNPPQINAEDQLSTTVPEKEAAGYQFAPLSVSDPDLLESSSTEQLSVTVTDAVTEVTDVPFSAVIKTNFTTIFILTTTELDVNVRNFYQLRITVQDLAGLSDSVVINVTVGNVNEAPTCADTTMTADVSVRQNVGTIVAVVQCSDPDRGDVRSYSLQGSELFTISSSGTVTVASSLAGLASVDSLTLQITVTDQGGLTASVQLDLTINNLYPPVCNNQPYSNSLSEDTAANVCFDVNVNCTDEVANEQISYVLVSGNATQVFRNSTNSPSLGRLQLCTSVTLKNLYGIYMANIKASSSYGETQFAVSLNVNDINDPPTFSQGLYSETITEDKTVGYIVLTVQATDPDSGAAGIILYESTGISNSDLFDLDQNTGTITVAGQLDVDQASQSGTFTFIIEALDSTPQPKTSSVTVQISVTDVNDNAPVCTPPTTTVSLALTDPVGTPVTTLSCSDGDKSEVFRRTGYRLTNTNLQGFAVNSTGQVYLSAPLSRDATSYTINVEAYDLDNPSLNFLATVTVNINSAIPPVCDPPSITGTLRETQPVMDCPYNEVICRDPTEGDVTIVQETGSGTQYMETRRNQGNSQLGLNACIKTSIKNQFGNYELQVEVTNGLASTTVTWTFEVININEAPYFNQSLFEATVDEGLDINQRILDIIVFDPDEDLNVANFEIDSVTASLANNADFNNQLNNTLLFAQRGFYAVKTMNATTRNLYKYNLRVQDGEGLYGEAEAIIHVRDINSAPVCPNPNPGATLTILADVGSEVYKVFCFDTDKDPENKELSFRITGGDPDNYFNMTNDGTVRVAKKLPRTYLYGKAAANLTVEVRDNGTPSYTTNVYLNVQVDYQIASQCNPVLTPPDLWVIESCATLTMDCTDPTLPSQTDHLSYTPRGNYTGQFRLTAQGGGVFSLCYLLTNDSSSQVTILVENGLQAKIYTEIIHVQYSAGPPVFTSAEYSKEVTENFPANTVILTVNAISAALIGAMRYRVIGDSSTAGWDSYFQLDQTSGNLTSLVQLRDLANQIVRLRVEAEDTGSQLRTGTQVQITVTDINEAPTCTTMPNLDLDVTATMDTQVVAFSCSDPDVKLEYKTFAYQLSGDGVPGVFALTPEVDPVSITTSTELSVTTPSYTLQLSVTDGGSPPLNFSETFTINISLLPPPLSVEVTEQTYESILVQWRYERLAFYSVTQSYKVILTPPQGAVIESEFQGSEIRQFNMTGLQAETDYSLVVQAVTRFGIRDSVPQSVTTPVVPILSTFVCTIRVTSEDFNLRHRDTGSQMYFNLEQKIVQSFDNFLGNGNTPGYVRSEVKGFRPDNSVFVDMIVYVDQFGNVTKTLEAVRSRVNSGWLEGDLSVDSGYFHAFEGDGYIMIDSIDYSPRPAFNGTDVAVTCKVLTVGYPSNAQFNFYWMYDGTILQPTSRSRYTISNTTDTVIYENKQTMLDVSPMLTKHAGVYGCMVSDEDRLQTVSSDIAVSVRGQPVVTLTPRSQTVNSGDPVILVCALEENENMFSQFVWYKDGALLQDAPGLDITPGDNNETLTIASVLTSAVYGCQGTGEAGAGARVEAHVGVVPTGTAGDIVCDITTEVRDRYVVRWPTTAPNTVAIDECPLGFIGEVTRACDATGLWRPSVFNCIKPSLQQIEDQVNAIQDGTSTDSLSSAINQLADETDRALLDGDLDVTLATLDNIVAIVTSPADSPDVSPAEAEVDTENYLRIASNLISEDNKPTWESRLAHNQEGAIAVPRGVEGYLRGRISHLSPSEDYFKTFTEDNVYAEVGKGERSAYNFPDRSQTRAPAWLKDSSTRISIPTQAMQGHTSLGYGSSFYQNIPDILETRFLVNGEIDDKIRHINADTVTFQVMGDIGIVDPPARIFFQHFLANYSDPQCVSWDVNKNAYVTDGCYMVTTSDEMTECACNHFTNFAILMSPGKTPAADIKALSIISAVGCALSIFFLLLTIVCYLIVWRYVKSDRAVLLINLCVALIIAYIVFLAGVGRAENEDVCTAVSLLLHFFYLAVFFLMLAYGIEIGVTIIYVFATSSRIKWLLPLAWGIPLVIVAISAGVTQLDGYGNDSFCWLSLEDGLLWAFVGPAAFVILFNFIIVIAVFRKMFKSSAMLTKTDRERAKAGIRSLCVLLPILGLTWVFGVFSVNEDLVVFQYIFAVCNSLQGVFIFLFHCALNKQLKDAFKQRKARKKSLQTFDKSFQKNQHSSTASSGLYSDSSKPNNDSGFVTESTNPFLEADRQMKEMYEKNKTGAATYDNNKLSSNKKDGVDLEDVKISNILRESEVMGGTAGISSILQTQSSSLPDTTRVTDDEKRIGLRQSAVSSHKYDYIDSGDISKPASASQKYDYIDAASSAQPTYTETAVYIRHETETPKTSGYEPLNQPYSQKITVSNDSLGASKDKKKGRGQENLTDKQKGKIYGSPEKVRKDGSAKSKEGSGSGATKSQLSKSSKSSRSDEDYEVRVLEPYHSKTHVYMPYGRGLYQSLERLRGVGKPSSSAQNISSISTALPTITYDQYQAKAKGKVDSPRKADSSLKKKEKQKKKPSVKDRSKAYEYSFESTYLGDRSRHASLENMNSQNYSPYSQMPGMGGYTTGRPTHQPQQWDQYRYPAHPQRPPQQQQSRQPYYRGDYW